MNFFTQSFDFIVSFQVLHFATDHKRKLRWLAHFYSFLWWENRDDERHCKRFARDAFRYRDEIFCTAAKIVAQLRADAAALAQSLLNGSNSSSFTSTTKASSEASHYSAFHIRRSDSFQFKAAKISMEAIVENVGHLLNKRELLYVATDDELNTAWLDPLRATGHTVRKRKKRFSNHLVCLRSTCIKALITPRLIFYTLVLILQVKTLKDYLPASKGKQLANPEWVGMIEQVIAANGRVFVGTYWSTFTSFVARMRGYQVGDPALVHLLHAMRTPWPTPFHFFLPTFVVCTSIGPREEDVLCNAAVPRRVRQRKCSAQRRWLVA